MKIFTTSREDYLKAILVLRNQLGEVHSVDVARYLGITKPSVSRAVSALIQGGFLRMEADHTLQFTPSGLTIAEQTYERHKFFTRQLVSVGVDRVTAEEDACRMEHAISESSFQKLKAKVDAQDT